jgi:hypothetical protein
MVEIIFLISEGRYKRSGIISEGNALIPREEE